MFGLNIRKATAGLRVSLASAALGFLCPKLSRELSVYRGEWSNNDLAVNRVPRPFALMLKEVFGDEPLRGAEIGFGFGANAVSLCSELNISKLFCVDPLVAYRENFVKITKFAEATKKLPITLKTLNKIEFLKMSSDEGFKVLPADLDFVYIDGNHEYEFVFRDLQNAFKHVQIGGFVGGHDFTYENQGVLKAVFDTIVYSGLTPRVKFPDFWFRRPAFTDPLDYPF